MRRARLLPLLLVVLLTAGLATTALAQPPAEDTAAVTVVHGIPDTPVDVWINGDPALPGFEPGTVTDEIEFAVGSYDLAVYLAGDDPDESDPVLSADGVELTADLNASIVAHLSADGAPALAIFVNDTSAVDEDTARVAVRHTAAAPAVDVFANGGVLIEDLANPDEVVTEVPADTYSVAVGVTGAPIEDAVIGPVDLTFPADTLSIVYAVYAAADGSITALTQSVDLSTEAPIEPPPGDGDREITRLGGTTRIETAVVISQYGFPEGADLVYLATAHNFPDALVAGSLTGGPILLVPECGDLPQVVAEEINRLGATEIIGLGGEDAICNDVLAQAASA